MIYELRKLFICFYFVSSKFSRLTRGDLDGKQKYRGLRLRRNWGNLEIPFHSSCSHCSIFIFFLENKKTIVLNLKSIFIKSIVVTIKAEVTIKAGDKHEVSDHRMPPLDGDHKMPPLEGVSNLEIYTLFFTSTPFFFSSAYGCLSWSRFWASSVLNKFKNICIWNNKKGNVKYNKMRQCIWTQGKNIKVCFFF